LFAARDEFVAKGIEEPARAYEVSWGGSEGEFARKLCRTEAAPVQR
jgi:hypothetical protein